MAVAETVSLLSAYFRELETTFLQHELLAVARGQLHLGFFSNCAQCLRLDNTIEHDDTSIITAGFPLLTRRVST
jgi:hypothetical protein